MPSLRSGNLPTGSIKLPTIRRGMPSLRSGNLRGARVPPAPFGRAGAALRPASWVGVVAAAPRTSFVWSCLLARCRLHICTGFLVSRGFAPCPSCAGVGRGSPPALSFAWGTPAPTLFARSLRSRPPFRSGYGTAVFRAGSAPSLRSVAPPALSFLPSLRSGFRFPSLRRSLRSLRWGDTHRSGCDPRCALPSVGAAGALAGGAARPRSLSRRQVWLRPFVRLWCPAGSC